MMPQDIGFPLPYYYHKDIDAQNYLRDAYAQPHRHYHTATHIAECVELFNMLMAVDPEAASISREALIWHDVHYHVGQPKFYNELRSAQAFVMMQHRHWTKDELREICRLIELTASHNVDPEDGRGEIVVSIDLAILGATRKRYQEYAQQIRAEFVSPTGFSVEQYNKGRIGFLRTMLEKDTIYPWYRLRRRLEHAARENMCWELETLEN